MGADDIVRRTPAQAGGHPVFAENRVVREFRCNAFFAAEDAPMSEAAGYRPELSGPIADKRD